jgi:hypothetical protein
MMIETRWLSGCSAFLSLLATGLELVGYVVEIKNTFKGAYRSYVRIPNVLFDNGLSKHKNEKMLIQVDAKPQEFEYKKDKVIINKFDLFLQINAVPVDILLAQKIYAVFKRKRAMGRAFCDAVSLLGKTKVNISYLRPRLKIKDAADLKRRLLLKCEKLDFKKLAQDTEPFLFTPSDAKKFLFFHDYVKNYEF